MSQISLATLLTEATKTEPILEVVGFILVFGSFFLAIFFVYQLVYYSVILGKLLFGATQKSKGKIAANPWVSIPVALFVGGIILYLLVAYGVIDLSGWIDGIAGWFTSVFTKN